MQYQLHSTVCIIHQKFWAGGQLHAPCFQGEDEEADWDLELLNEEDDGVVHWVSCSS